MKRLSVVRSADRTAFTFGNGVVLIRTRYGVRLDTGRYYEEEERALDYIDGVIKEKNGDVLAAKKAIADYRKGIEKKEEKE